MSGGAWTALVALIGILGAAVTGGFAYKAADKATRLTVDRAVYDSMREDFKNAQAELRELKRENDTERRHRIALEEAVHRLARALHAAGIPIPLDTEALLRPPSGGTG